MKKHIILAAVAALATLTACSNEDEEEPQVPGAEVNFTINNTVTRATTDNTGLTTFQNDDKVFIYSKGLYAQEMEGVEFKVSGTNLTPTFSNVTYRYNGTKGATFTAYHYNDEQISGTIEVGNNQSVSTSFMNYDLMTAQVQVNNPSSDAINFDFKHRFSLVKVDVTEIEKVGLAISSVVINNVKCSVTWSSTDNSISAASGNETSVKMGRFDSSSKEFWAIIPAQTISATDLIEVVTTTYKVYTYTGTGNVEFKEGEMKKFTLSVTGFNTVSASIATSSRWTEAEEVTGTTSERILELITAEQGTFSASTSINTATQAVNGQNDTQLTEGWYAFKQNADKIEYSSTNSGLLFNSSEATWTKTNLFYVFNPEIIRKSISKKFVLTFKHKDVGNDNTKNTIRVCICNLGTTVNSKYYSFGGNNNWKYYKEGYSDFNEEKLLIDFTKFGSSSSLDEISTLDYKNVALIFAGCTTIDTYIQDIKVTEDVPN